jgi:hypothetical protein
LPESKAVTPVHAAGPKQLPEHRRDRCVGQGRRAYLHVAADKHKRAVACLGRELPDQS